MPKVVIFQEVMFGPFGLNGVFGLCNTRLVSSQITVARSCEWPNSSRSWRYWTTALLVLKAEMNSASVEDCAMVL